MLIDFLADGDIALSEDSGFGVLGDFLADAHGFTRREQGDDVIFHRPSNADRSIERDDVDGRLLIEVPVDRDVALGSDDGG